MDPSAQNYDSKATVQTLSWCVPLKAGCMLPSAKTLSLGTGGAAGRLHFKDGGALNFDPSATTQAGATCTIYREGCMNATAVNYDSYATTDGGNCYYDPKPACLDKTALNFNCTDKDSFTACTHTERWAVPTKHDERICNSVYSPPPVASPATPPVGAGLGTTKPTVNLQMELNADLNDITPKVLTGFETKVAVEIGISVDDVTATASAGSVTIDIEIVAASDADQAAIQTKMATTLSSPTASTDFFVAELPAGVTVISTPVIEKGVKFIPAPPAPPPDSSMGGMIGGIVGGLGGFFGLLMGIGWYMKNKKAKAATYPA